MEKIRLLLDNVCTALDWAFSPSGKAQAARELAALFWREPLCSCLIYATLRGKGEEAAADQP
jgi:hypothetical protein